MGKVNNLSDPLEIKRLCTQVAEEEKEKYVTQINKDGQSPDNECLFDNKEIIEALNRNEDGDAWLYVEMHRGLFVYDTATGCWYKWAGHFWQEDILNDAMRAIDAVVSVYGQELSRLSWEQQKEVMNESRKYQ
ncbi:MAG: hypothetical protein ABFD82_07835 [Syntrophaceae bacterium]